MWIESNWRMGVGAALALFTASAAYTEPSGEAIATDVDGRWIPSFAFAGGSTVQRMDGASVGRCELGRPEEAVPIPGVTTVERLACRDPDVALTPPVVMPNLFDPNCPDNPSPDGRTACLRPKTAGEETIVTPFVGASLQLMTPRLSLIPGRPRGFFGGELVTFLAQEQNLAKEARPGRVQFPEGKNTAATVSGPTLFGTGSRVSSEIQRFGWSARAGLAFPFEFLQRRVWFKPSFGWLQYELDFDAALVAGIKDDPVDDPNAVSFGPGIREVSFSAGGSETFDGIGPGIELELDAGRIGPIGISVFMNADVYWILGKRSFSFSDSVSCPAFDAANPGGGCATGLIEDPRENPPPQVEEFLPVPDAAIGADNYRAEFDFGVHPVSYRGGVGIRFHWLGR